MKKQITGKEINEWINKNNPDLPSYWGDKFDWSYRSNRYTKKVDGAFIAKKYKTMIDLIEETKAEVHVLPNEILIKYNTGQAKICRDIMTDNFLLPLININVGFNSITV